MQILSLPAGRTRQRITDYPCQTSCLVIPPYTIFHLSYRQAAACLHPPARITRLSGSSATPSGLKTQPSARPHIPNFAIGRLPSKVDTYLRPSLGGQWWYAWTISAMGTRITGFTSAEPVGTYLNKVLAVEPQYPVGQKNRREQVGIVCWNDLNIPEKFLLARLLTALHLLTDAIARQSLLLHLLPSGQCLSASRRQSRRAPIQGIQSAEVFDSEGVLRINLQRSFQALPCFLWAPRSEFTAAQSFHTSLVSETWKHASKQPIAPWYWPRVNNSTPR